MLATRKMSIGYNIAPTNNNSTISGEENNAAEEDDDDDDDIVTIDRYGQIKPIYKLERRRVPIAIYQCQVVETRKKRR